MLEQKISLAWDEFQKFKQFSLSERKNLLLQLAEALLKNKQQIAQTINQEMNKLMTEAIAEVEKSATACVYYSENLEKYLSPRKVPTHSSLSEIQFAPLGPILAIMPWNFPVWQVLRVLAPAMAVGNVVCLKHAENCNKTAQLLEEICQKLHSTQFLINFPINHQQTAQLIADPRVRGVTLTGSSRAGSEVAALAGKHLKKVVLELGGSDAYIVFSSSDLDAAAIVCATARLTNSGQSCVSGKRFLVQKEVYEEFLLKLKASMQATDIAPLASKKFAQQLRNQVAEICKSGAKIYWQNQPRKDEAYFPATILTVPFVTKELRHEEFFGPVALVIPFVDEAEAVAIANDCDYGLGAVVFSQDQAQVSRMVTKIESGMVFINQQLKSDSKVPFGGVKNSGFGRELGEFGIYEFVNIRTVVG